MNHFYISKGICKCYWIAFLFVCHVLRCPAIIKHHCEKNEVSDKVLACFSSSLDRKEVPQGF